MDKLTTDAPPTLCLSVEQAAKELGMSDTQVYKLCDKGVLPHVRVGRRVLLHRERLDEWLRSRITGGVVQG